MKIMLFSPVFTAKPTSEEQYKYEEGLERQLRKLETDEWLTDESFEGKVDIKNAGANAPHEGQTQERYRRQGAHFAEADTDIDLAGQNERPAEHAQEHGKQRRPPAPPFRREIRCFGSHHLVEECDYTGGGKSKRSTKQVHKITRHNFLAWIQVLLTFEQGIAADALRQGGGCLSGRLS